MPDRSARATGIRWTEPGLRMHVALLPPLALSVGLMALKRRGGSFSGDAMACCDSAEPVKQQRCRLTGKSIRGGDLLASGGLLFCRRVGSALRLRRAGFSGLAVVARWSALLLMVATLVASLNNSPNCWSEGFRRLLFVLSLTWLPAVISVRHPPRSIRAAFPRHPVSHVQ